MTMTSLDHYSIRTTDLDATRDFYVDVLGLIDGDRPPFPFPGLWLYCGDRAVVHVLGIDRDDPSGLEEYLGARDEAGLQGSGALDHVAFKAVNAQALRTRLQATGTAFRERRVPEMGLYQLFLTDPNGITVELNYSAEEAPA